MSITVLSIGKKSPVWLETGIAEYSQRMRKPFDVDWQLLPHANVAERAIDDESARLLSRCREQDFVVLLDERGEELSSPKLSKLLQRSLDDGKRCVLIIGGAYGVNQQVKDGADFVWSISPLVFPHQLMRLVVAEQLYRAQTIALGQPYHHQ